MRRLFISSLFMLALAAFFAVPVPADQSLARFEGGIGSTPLRSGPAANLVQGVNPGGVPWVITSLEANVQDDGHIQVDGRGLLLAGGNNIGRSGGQSVRARLFCGATAPTAHDSAAVPLDSDGDFTIDGPLTPMPPVICGNPTLLILNGTGTAWFAAGVPRS
jgi:hypothetical protein